MQQCNVSSGGSGVQGGVGLMLTDRSRPPPRYVSVLARWMPSKLFSAWMRKAGGGKAGRLGTQKARTAGCLPSCSPTAGPTKCNAGASGPPMHRPLHPYLVRHKADGVLGHDLHAVGRVPAVEAAQPLAPPDRGKRVQLGQGSGAAAAAGRGVRARARGEPPCQARLRNGCRQARQGAKLAATAHAQHRETAPIRPPTPTCPAYTTPFICMRRRMVSSG